MDFVFTLHSHLPYVLNHGRWPHGSDWICEAAADPYRPLRETFLRREAEDTPAPVTIGFTPVLANQLASPVFVREMEAFFDQRLVACTEAPASLAKTGEQHLLPLVEYWRARLLRLRRLFHQVDGDLVAAFRALRRFAQPDQWQEMMRQGMACDFSWERSVQTYLDVYRRALAHRAALP